MGIRPQDTAWLSAWAFDRLSLGGRRPDLWHALDPNTPLSPLGGSRTLMSAYDLNALHEPFLMKQIRAHRRAVYRLYLRRLREARLVLAISNTTGDDVHAALGIPRERIRVVYPAFVPPGDSGAADESHTPDSPPDLLFVGVPDANKQPELAISALAELRKRGYDVRLRFCGHQRQSDRERLDRTAAAAAMLDHVDHLGRIDDAQLNALYRSSVLLAVSRREGFGLPPIESLLAGGRVVCGSAPVYRETVGDAATFATRYDGHGLADAYEAAIAHRITAPPEELVRRFSPRTVADGLIAAYESALS
jgi:glycosyltransferase involved in cell wall biosynthesis